MDNLHALRKLARTPGFTLLAVLTLAIGIAATTTIFSVVNGVLLNPLPYPESDRLVTVEHSAAKLGLDRIGTSPDLYHHYREHNVSPPLESPRGDNEVFEGIAIFDTITASLTGDGNPERLLAASVGPGFFEVLRVPPMMGRSFEESEGAPGGEAVVILSAELWERRFAGDPDILGRIIEVDSVAREVVGVAPPGFSFIDTGLELWLPEVVDPEQQNLGSFGSGAVARLQDGMSREAAETGLRTMITDLEAVFPEQRAATILGQSDFSVELVQLRDRIVGDDFEAALWILLGTVGLVLLVACANVANLFLVRAEGRQRETALRTALGATPIQLTFASLTESLGLALAAGALGLGGAALAVRGLVRFGPEDLPRLHEVAIDGRVVFVCLVVSILTGVVFGLIPGLRRIRDLSTMLKDGSRSATEGRERHLMRHLLVGAQVSLALVLLICSGLMVRSFVQLSEVDPGFASEGVLTANLALPEADYPDDLAVADFYRRLIERVRALPGVESAGLIETLPLAGRHSASGYAVEDYPEGNDGLPPVMSVNRISPEALGALGVPIVEGRGLTADDEVNRRGIMLISQSLARKYWPNESAIGKRIGFSTPVEGSDDPWYEVVGVVGNVHIQELSSDPEEMVYHLILDKVEGTWRVGGGTLVVRTSGDPLALADVVRSAVWEIDPNLPVSRVRPLTAYVSDARAGMAFTVILLLVAGVVALVLGSVGTFGIISYLVARRTSEFGVRFALGARRRSILAMVLGQALVLAGAGTAVGIAAAFGMTRVLESILFEVDPLDPLTFVAVPVFLLTVAVVASLVPAVRAARTEPSVALRHE